jgi:hypothetical protein
MWMTRWHDSPMMMDKRWVTIVALLLIVALLVSVFVSLI